MSAIVMENVSKCYEKNIFAVHDINFSVAEGEIVAMLGPSGCGKTTTLRIIAGFEKQCEGILKLQNHVISAANNWVPVEKRGVGMVFQDYALFPHLTVEKNIAFGLTGKKKRDAHEIVKKMIELVELEGLERRYPHELSGGQKQRVALARALAPSPHLLLMDEPFSNLDAELKYSMRFEIRRILKKANIATIFVTHDQKDALAIADKIIVMSEGKVEQIGTPYEVYYEPATPFVAKFISRCNLLEAKEIDPVFFSMLTKTKSETVPKSGWLSIRREQIKLTENGPFTGMVKGVAFEGEFTEISLQIGNGKQQISLLTNQLPYHPPQINEKVNFNIEEYRYFSDDFVIRD